MGGFRLRSLPAGVRIGITGFITALGLGYLFALLNVYVHYAKVDGKPGLSAEDVIITFYGSDQQTLLEAKITTGSMSQYITDDLDRGKIVAWVKGGTPEAEYTSTIKPIISSNCTGCHSAAGLMAQTPLTDYKEVTAERLVKRNRGKSLNVLVQSSHTHLISLSMMFLVLGALFCCTGAPEWLKSLAVPVPFLGVLLDVGGWWLTKMAPIFAYPMMWGGALMGSSFAIFAFGILGECWLARAPTVTAAQLKGESSRSR
jgi:hypothetical protein